MAVDNGSSEQFGSLWIDFLLLPTKLEEHLASLASGTVTAPSFIDLIVMFLERAVVSRKLTAGASTNKDIDGPGAASNSMGKTASVLCEQAAKVAVAGDLTLADIESIPSQQIQFLLLKALIRHDKLKSLVHQCDIHRWLLHNILKSQPSGSSLSNTTSPAASLSSWVLSDDFGPAAAAESGATVDLGNCDGFEEGQDSIAFLETVLGSLGGVGNADSRCQTAVQDSEICRNRSVEDVPVKETCSSSLNEVNKCQILFDIAQVHFLRGRIWKAHDTFTSCGKLLEKLGISGSLMSVNVENVHLPHLRDNYNSWNSFHVPREKLAGFIIACRMVLQKHILNATNIKKVALLSSVDINESPLQYLGFPSSTNQAVIACEQMRWLVRSISVLVPVKASLCGSVCDPAPCDSLVLQRKVFKHQDGSALQSHDFAHFENLEGVMVSTYGVSCLLMEYVLASNLQHLDGEDLVKSKTEDTSLNTNDLLEEGQQMIPSDVIAQKYLVAVFVNDLLKGYLPWDYRSSLERDLSIPMSTRYKLIACNTLRNILLGAPLESLLKISEHFDCNVGAVHFLLNLIATIVKRLKGEDESSESEHETQKGLNVGKRKRKHEAEGINKEECFSRIHQCVKYICCVLDKPWCWAIAQDFCLLTDVQTRNLTGGCNSGLIIYPVQDEEHDISSVTAGEDCTPFLASRKSFQKEDIVAFLKLMQAEKLCDYEAILKKGIKPCDELSLQKPPPFTHNVVVRLDPEKVSSSESYADNAFSKKEDVQSKCVASVLRRKALDAAKHGKQYKLAVHLYNQARLLDSEDNECDIMLWLLEKLTRNQGEELKMNGQESSKRKRWESLPTLELLEFSLQKLIDEELWTEMSELCNGLSSHINEDLTGHNVSFKPGKIDVKRARKVTQILKVASLIGKLIPFCSSSKASMASNSFSEDICYLTPTMRQIFEDLLCHLFDFDRIITRDGSKSQAQGFNQKTMQHSCSYGADALPLMSKISNPRVLMCLAALTAGWLQRCHMAKLTPWPLDVERYGVLASIMVGVPLSSTVGPSTASIYRQVPLSVSPESVRDLFRMLLKKIVDLPDVVDLDKDKGHCWLQGLGDLAFEDDDHVKALQYYLQAGAIRSACYCYRPSMPRDIFSPWIIGRMIRACRAIGAGLQGAVLCQCLPIPDYDLAFRILQDSLVIMDQDMELYSECIWEVPILELLIHMHTKSGDETRVRSLILLLQQPTLNVHNPSSIRKSHIDAMEQQFLQRFYEEIL